MWEEMDFLLSKIPDSWLAPGDWHDGGGAAGIGVFAVANRPLPSHSTIAHQNWLSQTSRVQELRWGRDIKQCRV